MLLLVGGIGAIAAVIMATLSGTPGAQAATKPFKKGSFKALYVMPMSGPLGVIGKVESAGAKAAANYINSQGGINGHKVEVTIIDDVGDGAKATAAALQASSATKYNFIFCGSTQAEGLPCAAAIDKNNALKIPGTQDGSFNRLKRTFGPGLDYPIQGKSMIEYMIKRNIKSFAALAPDNASGRSGVQQLERWANASKGKIKFTRSVFVPLGTADTTPQLQQAMATNPAALTISAFNPVGLAMLRSRTKLGLNIPVYGDVSFATGSLNSLTKEQRSGVFNQVYPVMVNGSKAQRSKEFKAFANAFHAVYGNDTMPLGIQAGYVVWNPLMAARAAAKKAKSIDGAKMAKAMPMLTTKANVPGWIGVSTLYSKTSHLPRGSGKDFGYEAAGTTDTSGYLHPGS